MAITVLLKHYLCLFFRVKFASAFYTYLGLEEAKFNKSFNLSFKAVKDTCGLQSDAVGGADEREVYIRLKGMTIDR